MWRWRLIQIQILVSAGLLATNSLAFAVNTSTGPTSQEEAQFIWTEGKKAYSNSRFQEATQYLQRLLDRYPGDSHLGETTELLGISYFRLNQPQKAIPLLQATISVHGQDLGSQNVRLVLGKSYLSLKKFDEALLVIQEIQQAPKASTLSVDLISESTLIKGQALFAKNHLDRARLALLNLESDRTKINNPLLREQIGLFKLQLELEACRLISKSGGLSELQVKHQVEKRTECLIETLSRSKSLFSAKNSDIQKSASIEIENAFRNLKLACLNPPSPDGSHRKKRTRKELERYQAELAFLLKPLYKRAVAQAQDLLQTWKAGSPTEEGDLASSVVDALNRPDTSSDE